MHQSLLSSKPDSESDTSRTRINTAGVTCHAWSSEGKGEGAAHESEIPLAVWLGETMYLFEQGAQDVVFLECTPRFPAQDRLASIFSKIAHVFSWHDGPELHGWPHRRRRVLAALISKETMEWLGSPSLIDLQADYKERFHRQMCADGSILLQASFEDRVQEMHTLAQLRKNNVSLEEMGNVMADSNHGKEVARLTLPPGGIDRLAQWEQEFKDRRASDQSLSAFLCDVDHSVNTKGRLRGKPLRKSLFHG